MVSVVAGLREVARLVERQGFPVTFVPGWETRGREELRPAGAMFHWTAGGSGDTSSLSVVTHGRPGLRNALCNTYSSRSARLYVVAARTAWHGGAGSWRGVSGNSRWLGHEAENSGRGDWTQRHIDLTDVVAAAEREVFGLPLEMVIDHYEYAPSRKVDCRDVGGPQRRARVARVNLGAPSPAPAPIPTPAEEEHVVYELINFPGGPTVGLVNHCQGWYSVIPNVEALKYIGKALGLDINDRRTISSAFLRSLGMEEKPVPPMWKSL